MADGGDKTRSPASKLDGLSREDLAKFVKKQTILLQRSRAKCEELQNKIQELESTDTPLVSEEVNAKVAEYERIIKVSYEEHKQELEALSASKDGRINELEALSVSKEGRINELESLSVSKDGRINELEALSVSTDDRINELEALSASTDSSICELEAKIRGLEEHGEKSKRRREEMEEELGCVRMKDETLMSSLQCLQEENAQLLHYKVELSDQVQVVSDARDTALTLAQSLQKDNSELSERLEDAQKMYAEVKDQLDDTKTDKSRLERQNADMETKNEDVINLSKELAVKNEELQSLHEKTTALDAELRDSVESYTDLRQRLSDVEEMFSDKTEECDGLSVQIVEFRQRLAVSESTISDCDRCEKWKIDEEALRLKVQSLEAKKDCEQCSILRRDVEALKSEVAGCQKQNEMVALQIEELRLQIYVKDCEIDEKSKKLEVFRDDIARLNEYLSGVEAGRRDESEKCMRIEVEAEKLRVELLVRDEDRACNRCTTYAAEIKSLNVTLTSAPVVDDALVENLKREVGNLQKECGVLMSHKSSMEYELNEVKEDRDMLIHEGQSNKEQLREWEQIMDLLRNDKETVTRDLEDSEVRLLRYGKEVKDVIKILQEGLEEGEREAYNDDVFYYEQYDESLAMRKVSVDVVERIQRLVKQLDQIRAEKRDGMIEVQGLKSDLEFVQQEKETIERELGSQSVILSLSQEKAQQGTQECERLIEDKARFYTELMDVQRRLSDLGDSQEILERKSQLEASLLRVVELTDQVKQETERASELETKLEERGQYVKEIENKVGELSDKLTSSKKLYEMAQSEIESMDTFVSNSVPHDEVAALRLMIETLENEKSALANDLRETEEQCMNMEQSLESSQNDRDELSVKINESLEKIEILEQGVSSAENNMNQASTESVSLKQQLDSLLTELSAAKDEATRLRTSDARRDELQSANDRLLETKQNFEEQLENMIQERQVLSAESDRLTVELQDSNVTCDQLRTSSVVIEERLQQTESLAEQLQRDLDSGETGWRERVERVEQDLARTVDELDKTKEDVRTKEEMLSDAERRLVETTAQCANLQSDVSEVRVTLNRLQGDQDGLRAQRDEALLHKSEVERQAMNERDQHEHKVHTLTSDLDLRNKQLGEARHEATQSSMMDLEMADYERSIKNINEQLLTREASISERDTEIGRLNDRVAQLILQTDSQDKQFGQSEDRANKLKQLLVKTKKDLANAKKIEGEQKHSEAQLRGQMEHSVQKVEEYKVQISETSSENMRLREKMTSVGETHQRSSKSLDLRCTQLQQSLTTTQCQLDTLQTEYDSYKVRVHNVLKQQKTRQLQENQLQTEREERERLENLVDQLRVKLQDTSDTIASLKQENVILSEEHERLLQTQERKTRESQEREAGHKRRIEHMSKEHQLSTNQITETIHRLTNQNDALTTSFEKETRSLHNDHSGIMATLNQQIRSLEKENARLLRDSVTAVGGVTGTGPRVVRMERETADSVMDLVTDIRHVERQSGEGMENVEAESCHRVPSTSQPSIVPFNQLLSTSLDDTMSVRSTTLHDDERQKNLMAMDMEVLKGTVSEAHRRIEHLTELLNESEATVSRFTEQARLLKEEIRRMERNQKREEETRNLEYLKNILMKFLSLKPGTERSQLLPVMTTMLKLNEDEKTILNSVALGDDGANPASTGWGAYLHRWSAL